MRTLTGGKRELLRRLAAMPFLDRLEMAALSGWSQSAVYEAARQLEDAGLIASVPHGTELVAPTRRFHLTADGLRRLAREEDLTPDRLLRSYPLAARWRRVLLERLDAVAVVYRLASAVANIEHPHPLPLVPRHVDGRRHHPSRREDHRHRPAGPRHRPHRLLQADRAAQGRAAARRNPARPPRRDPAALRPRDSAPGVHANGPSPGAGGGGSGHRRRGVAAVLGQRRRQPKRRHRPDRTQGRAPRRAAPGAGLHAPGHRRAGERAGRPRAHAARPAETHREAPSSTCSPTGPGSPWATSPVCWASPTSAPPNSRRPLRVSGWPPEYPPQSGGWCSPTRG